MTLAVGQFADCASPGIDALGAALAAGVLAVLGTLTAKRRPAGKYTRASDRAPQRPAPPPADWSPDIDEAELEFEPWPQPPPRSRLRRAAAELRTKHLE